MERPCLWQHVIGFWHVGWRVLGLLGFVLLLARCTGGETNNLSEQTARNPQLERQAVENLLQLYQSARRQEDIDRLQELLHLAGTAALAQAKSLDGSSCSKCSVAPAEERSAVGEQNAEGFREAVTAAFHTHDAVAFQILAPDIRLDTDPPSVSFLEVESRLVGHNATLEQQTRAGRQTFRLVRDERAGTVSFRISEVVEEGVRFQVVTPGRVLAGEPARVTVSTLTGGLRFATVEVEVPETGMVQRLVEAGDVFRGLFVPPAQRAPQPLRIRIRGTNGEDIVLPHQYRLQVPGDWVVQRIPAFASLPFFAAALAPDGTVWFGGKATSPGSLGTIVQIAADGETILNAFQPTNALLPAESVSRIEDVAFDHLGRLHSLFIARQENAAMEEGGDVVGNGVVVMDPRFPDQLCQTVNVFAPSYPLQVRDLRSGALLPSPSTRIVAAEAGRSWLYGSDGGVSQVEDRFQPGQCPENGVAVRYGPVFRRHPGALLANSVPAFVVGTDGVLWFGTALGLTRLQHGQFTAVPFDPESSLEGNPQTLEEFFQAVAEAIFTASPIATVTINGISFVDEFAAPLRKADLIFSAVEDRQRRLWVGTFGAGIRRVEVRAGVPQDTLHLTRQDGLGSNIILALAVGPDDSLWVATEEGVSRLRAVDNTMIITNFSLLDGLALPVRDLTVDGAGTVWLATEGGLFRIVSQGGRVRGTVRDPAGRPIMGADVIASGTPFRAVTDAEGRFVLANLPPGWHLLEFDSAQAVGGPFLSASQETLVTTGEHALPAPVILTPQVTGTSRLVIHSGNGQRGTVGQQLGTDLVVAVLHQNGQGLPGIPVTFTISRGHGSFALPEGATRVTEVTMPTDANGQAAAALFLGTRSGANQVQAHTGALPPVVFTATGQADRSTARLIEVRGNNQSGTPGLALPTPLVVQLEDQFRNPLAGESITAAIIHGATIARFLSSPTVQTDAAGRAEFRLRLTAAAVGDIIVEVQPDDLPVPEPAQFKITATIIEGPPALNGIVVEADGSLLVLDASFDRLLRVHPQRRDVTIVSSNADGRAPFFETPTGLAPETPASVVVVDRLPPAVLRVHLASGARTVITSNADGMSPSLIRPRAIAMAAPDVLVVADTGLGALVRVDPANGTRTVVPCNTGASLMEPRAIAVETPGVVIVADTELGALVRVNLATAACTIVSTAVEFPQAIALEAPGSLVVVDFVREALVRIDLATGALSLVSSATRGTGPFFSTLLPDAIAVTAADSLVALDAALAGGAVVHINARSGNRRILAFLRE